MVRKEKIDTKGWMKTTREHKERSVPGILILVYVGFPGGVSGKEPAC